MENFIGQLLEVLETGIREIFRVFLIGYQKGVSPFLGQRCRFYPSCSEYAVQVLTSKKMALPLGLLFVIGRLLRCNPCFRGGVDLPPQ